MSDKKEMFTLVTYEGDGYVERKFADPEEAKGFADATANIVPSLVAILFDYYNGMACSGNDEIWGCDYDDALI